MAKKELTFGDIFFLTGNLKQLENLRSTKLAYAVLKTSSKIESERKLLIQLIEKEKEKDQTPDQFIQSEKGREFLSRKSSVKTHKLDSIPDVEMTATELSIIDTYFLNTTEDEEDNGLPEGPDPIRP